MNTTTLQASPVVLVFDSGVGGLSILHETRQMVPHCRYHYACDNQAFPYGTKEEAELVERVELILKGLIARINPDIVVIACNTASTVALPKIRSHFTKPVVGVVPAIKPASALSTSRVIGLLATPATITRPYTQWLIDEFAPDATFIRVGSAELVTQAENALRGIAPDPEVLSSILTPIFDDPRTDTIVLACTHFPLLKSELTEAAPRAIHWVDSGNAIARRVASLIGPASSEIEGGTGNTGFTAWITAADPHLEEGLARAGSHSTEVVSYG
jgi:glutamate racemase